MNEDTIRADVAEKALAEGTRAHPKFAAMKPRLEVVKLFQGSQIVVKYGEDRREKGDPENFLFEKLVVKTYRALASNG